MNGNGREKDQRVGALLEWITGIDKRIARIETHTNRISSIFEAHLKTK